MFRHSRTLALLNSVLTNIASQIRWQETLKDKGGLEHRTIMKSQWNKLETKSHIPSLSFENKLKVHMLKACV